MIECEPLAGIVEDLIQVMHLQAKELEKLIERVEQVSGRLDYPNQISVIASELSELHLRIQKHRGNPPPRTKPARVRARKNRSGNTSARAGVR